jgi:hypothetical protein
METYDKKRLDAEKLAKAKMYHCKTNNYIEPSKVTLDMLSHKDSGPMLFEEAETMLAERSYNFDVNKDLCELLFTDI